MSMDLTVLAADDLRRDYAADCRLRGLADGSVVRTLRELRTIERDLGKLPSELTRAEYRSWLAGFDANSANFRLRCTRGFYSWLHREGLRDEPIGQGIRIRAIEEPHDRDGRTSA